MLSGQRDLSEGRVLLHHGASLCCGRCSQPPVWLTAQEPQLLLAPGLLCYHWGLRFCHIHAYANQKCLGAQFPWGKCWPMSAGGERICFSLFLSILHAAWRHKSFIQLRWRHSQKQNGLSQVTVSSVIYPLSICSPFMALLSFYLTSTSLGLYFHKLLALKLSLQVLSYRKPNPREKAITQRPDGESQNYR